ncbi:MAG: class I SAM-dependent RNA methyltransferase [Eubacteriales bacterium]|nr:class I SAM-dependent RNA methyltransferase [Eubacteriales bacterium]
MGQTYQLTATAAFGLEGVTARELRTLGFADVKTENNRVAFTGDAAEIVRANLWLRTAERVYVVLKRYPARTFTELFDGAAAYPWEEWIGRDSAFIVNGKCVRSKLMSVRDCQSILKKAIADRLCRKYGVKWLPETAERYSVVFSVTDDEVTLMLDSSGEGLHKRGYRTLNVDAPLRETTAAALLLLAGYDGVRPLIDPFCGSGTIPIEAYFIATDRAPGLTRDFDCTAWKQVPEQVTEQVREQARNRYRPDASFSISGYDVDPQAIAVSLRHARAAGAERIRFRQGDVRDLRVSEKNGLFLCNPPYGERLEERAEVEKLYADMKKVFDRAEGWRRYVLTSDKNFERIFGRKADARRKLYNGMIECCFYQYFVNAPSGKENGGVQSGKEENGKSDSKQPLTGETAARGKEKQSGKSLVAAPRERFTRYHRTYRRGIMGCRERQRETGTKPESTAATGRPVTPRERA